MTKEELIEELIEELKSHYNRDLRKQMVRAVLQSEKSVDAVAVQQQYRLFDQIFSYVIAHSGWNMPSNLSGWNPLPLEIMKEVFPKLETSKWYQERDLTMQGDIDVVVGEDTQ